MKKKTKIILLIVAILLIVCAVVFVFMVKSDSKQEGKLGDELNSLYTSLNKYPLDYEALENQLSTIVTTKDYAKVEKAIKNYSGDFVENMKQLDTILTNNVIINALNIENIKADGPDFNNTQNVLSESKTSLDTLLTYFSDYFTEEFALSYIKDMELDEYYTNLYKQYALGDNVAEMESTRDEILKSLNSVKTLIENEQEGINFLVTNKGKWEVKDDQLVIYSTSLTNQYNDIIAKLQEEAE